MWAGVQEAEILSAARARDRSMEASLAFGPWELAWHYSEPVAGDGASQHLVP